MKILIANRGAIAVRIMRACREMGVPTVAVYSDCDRAARHVREADQALHIGPSEAAQSYLRIDAIVDAARRSGADAVHPGYGFLAENAAFAHACQDAGLTFIGPSPDVIALMGSKTAARGAAIRAGVAVVPGTEQPFDAGTPDELLVRTAAGIGYPVVVKAVAGGGGKGMRVVTDPVDLLGIGPDRPLGGGRRVRRYERLSRAPDRAAPAHRDPAPGRPAWDSRSLRGARVLDPAPPPEGGGGVALERRGTRAAQPDRRRRPPPSRVPSVIPTPARSSSSWTTMGRSTSWR